MKCIIQKTDIIILGSRNRDVKALCNAFSIINASHSIVFMEAVAQLPAYLAKGRENAIVVIALRAKEIGQALATIGRLQAYPQLSVAVCCPPGIEKDPVALFVAGANICLRHQESPLDLCRSVRKLLAVNTQFASGALSRDTYFLLT